LATVNTDGFAEVTQKYKTRRSLFFVNHVFSFSFGYAILSLYIATGFPLSLFETFLFVYERTMGIMGLAAAHTAGYLSCYIYKYNWDIKGMDNFKNLREPAKNSKS
jgi:hypothetical protein